MVGPTRTSTDRFRLSTMPTTTRSFVPAAEMTVTCEVIQWNGVRGAWISMSGGAGGPKLTGMSLWWPQPSSQTLRPLSVRMALISGVEIRSPRNGSPDTSVHVVCGSEVVRWYTDMTIQWWSPFARLRRISLVGLCVEGALAREKAVAKVKGEDHLRQGFPAGAVNHARARRVLVATQVRAEDVGDFLGVPQDAEVRVEP